MLLCATLHRANLCRSELDALNILAGELLDRIDKSRHFAMCDD